MLVLGATVLAALFLVLVQQPNQDSATWLPYLAAVWALLLPVTSFVQVCAMTHSYHLPVVPACKVGKVLQCEDHRESVKGAALTCLLNDQCYRVQAGSELPPVPGDLQRLYSQSHLVLDAERFAAQR